MRQATLTSAGWPRFSAYKVSDDRRVVPASEDMTSYNVWQEAEDARSPQVLLDVAHAYRTMPGPEFEIFLVSWVARHGLLGLATARLIHASYAITESHGWGATRSGGRLLLMQVTPQNGQPAYDNFPALLLPGPIVETAVAAPGIGTSPQVEVVSPAEFWEPYIPDFASSPPEIGSIDFWRRYGEPVSDIVAAALTLESALFGTRSLSRLADDTALEFDYGTATLKFSSASLFGAYAAMAIEQASRGFRYARCDCGRYFAIRKLGSRSTKAYCSERCKARVKKRRARAARSLTGGNDG